MNLTVTVKTKSKGVIVMMQFMMFGDDGMIYSDNITYYTLHKKSTYYDDEDTIDTDVKDCGSIDDISDTLDRMIEFFSKEEEKVNEEKNQAEQDHSPMEEESYSEQCNDDEVISDTQYHFNFPEISCSSVGSQVHKILEEVDEIQEAVNLYSGDSYSRMKIIEETLDCIHACETFLNEIALSEDEINTVKDHVIHKNMRRNYYNCDTSSNE